MQLISSRLAVEVLRVMSLRRSLKDMQEGRVKKRHMKQKKNIFPKKMKKKITPLDFI